jgi:hypothetical protein
MVNKAPSRLSYGDEHENLAIIRSDTNTTPHPHATAKVSMLNS